MSEVYAGTYSLVPEVNSSWLCNTHAHAQIEPLSSPTMGLMMLLSTFQYQAPYLGSTYSNAANEVGKAAFVTSGGQATQDKAVAVFTKDGQNVAHSVGLTDAELGIAGGAVKTIRNKQLDFKGPRIYMITTRLTATQQSASLGLGWNFK